MNILLLSENFLTLPLLVIQETLREISGPYPIKWYILISAFSGCMIQEFIYWFELRHQISRGQIPPELTSAPYWVITVCSLFVFSIGSYFYFTLSENQADLNFFTIAIFSAGFPRLFKGAVQQLGPRPEKHKAFTTEQIRKFGIRDYFMMK